MLGANAVFSGENKFLNNNASTLGGAIYASLNNGSVNMTGTQNFIQNSARQGGAMAFIVSSKLILTESLQVNFVKNKAVMNGGAIFFGDAFSISQCTGQSIVQEECFVELSSAADIQLNFVHNTAGRAGTVLYGGSLYKCRLYVGGGVRDICGNRIGGNYSTNPVDVIKNISNIVSSDSITSDISSDPLHICMCAGNNLQCCLLYTSPSPRDATLSRMPSSA